MMDLNRRIFGICLFILFLSLSGCVLVKTKPVNLHTEKVQEKNEKSSKIENDSIGELIHEIPDLPAPLEVKIVGYVNVDLLEVFPSTENLTAINHVTRGTKLLIFDTKGDWANISADIEYPYWVDLASICFTERCWVKTKSYSPQHGLIKNSKNSLQSIEEKAQIHTSSNNYSKTKNMGNGRGYKNVDGNYISSPKKSKTQPTGATAKCRDGTWSFSQNRRGTCSGHGGVAAWL
ncbi:DUF3761 domain-containing protein [Acinetobacter baumannii]|uniref:DUF3761 domain-containing protein n=1 Tax=Acinetobacter baumannii TaxID=470 RepID=UPI0003462FB8|nr:DUF3761 domain-containing protein [Acinetobacter baumannii]MBP2809448.1 DUF3761 domain-containing protein [Acinetobacter baumannii]MCU4657999.1 DUF3761 domain-containing protein [Acinetobacter baumannii]MDC4331925.1 DUF3761 domain-containing protein [Acinetobacter baumannii]MDC4411248.1 DUF3761 domain-containing protein [Acinetobacter baumannii]MDC4528618.1 DUF3761 domain-containing protein [Acinetobacter baumannii]